MIITADILYDKLKETLTIERYGQKMQGEILSLPVFYETGMALKNGAVYILRTQDLPRIPSERCVYLCIDRRPVGIWSNYPGDVFFITDPAADLLTVLNHVQEIFDRLITWEAQMKSLQMTGEDIREMVRLSIPIFQNKIIVTDYNLQIVAYCEAADHDGTWEVRMCDDYEMVPKSHTILFQNNYTVSTSSREPYLCEVNGDAFYCINLYLEDAYMGVCSLSPDFHEFSESDLTLFQAFSKFVCHALAAQSKAPNSRFVTMKTIFTQLLQCLPVSHQSVERALNSRQRRPSAKSDASVWVAVTIRSANRKKTLPEAYLCASLEEILTDSTVIAFDNSLAAFCLLPDAPDSIPHLLELLTPFLQDMNFRAGVSEPFTNIFDTRSFYAQACRALETGLEQNTDSFVYRFRDYALAYMLKHCCGEFEPEKIMPASLLKLIQQKGSVDYEDTLKRYLDNGMNASRTAQEMFLHRSSLMPRIEKIRSMVSLDTPKDRLYILMCLYLHELYGDDRK